MAGCRNSKGSIAEIQTRYPNLFLSLVSLFCFFSFGFSFFKIHLFRLRAHIKGNFSLLNSGNKSPEPVCYVSIPKKISGASKIEKGPKSHDQTNFHPIKVHMLRLKTGEGPQRQSRCCHQRQILDRKY